MQNLDLEKAVNAWSPLASALFVPHSEEELDRIVALLDELIDEVGEDETHPLASLMEVLSVLIEHYEAAHVPELASAEHPQVHNAENDRWVKRESETGKLIDHGEDRGPIKEERKAK